MLEKIKLRAEKTRRPQVVQFFPLSPSVKFKPSGLFSVSSSVNFGSVLVKFEKVGRLTNSYTFAEEDKNGLVDLSHAPASRV